MLTQENNQTVIPITFALKWIGIAGGVWAILVILTATLAYLPEHPGFSLFTTYLSDIGDTAGWPQILFNAGTLIAVPIRYLVVVLLALRLAQFGAGRAFVFAILITGLISTTGTALMTATPFSVAPAVHKSGIGLYFLGVVVLQTMIFIREWSLRGVPRVLPVLSLVVVVLFIVFVTLFFLYMQGMISRNTPVIWEWLSILSSIVWMLAHSILLGKTDRGQSS